ncbi:GATA transcription factor 18-like isoform X2 [Panicum virgatum]|uniref:Uncharacterized protein n=1 Tax=Panicum virgatum TaxID=38727 RepID=A0A8T0NC51_PANVG|nr:GATA transcription factor 18-like isoform X2 [Panicum virgatum]KAG2546837.1 hypothetical protein PVAP13_9KG048100 [Panicum virgatum]
MPDADVDVEMRAAGAATATAAAASTAPSDDDGDDGTGEDEEDGEDVDDEDEDEDEEERTAPAPVEEPPAPAPVSAFPGNPNQLTLLFQGEIYVFESVTPDKVQDVLLLLGRGELPPDYAGKVVPSQNENKGYDDILRRTDIPAKRVASLLRFREKRKERNFDKKIRYAVRKEVALRMQRRKGQFAGRASLEGESPALVCDPGSQSSGLDFVSRESKCQNCGTSEKMTPAMRRGPAGPRTLCNACGLMWANKGTLRSCPKAKVESHVVAIEQAGNDNKVLVTPKNDNTSVSASNGEVTIAAEAGALKGDSI